MSAYYNHNMIYSYKHFDILYHKRNTGSLRFMVSNSQPNMSILKLTMLLLVMTYPVHGCSSNTCKPFFVEQGTLCKLTICTKKTVDHGKTFCTASRLVWVKLNKKSLFKIYATMLIIKK